MSEQARAALAAILAGADLAGPVPSARIAAAECRFGMEFPSSYRVFLIHFGAAVCDGFFLAGLPPEPEGDRPPYWDDALAWWERLQAVSRGNLPQHLLPISDDGQDSTFYLDCSRRDAVGESQVIVMGPGRDSDIPVAASFTDFVRARSSGAIW